MNNFIPANIRVTARILTQSLLALILLSCFNDQASDLVFVCAENNDLYQVLLQNGIETTRYDELGNQ